MHSSQYICDGKDITCIMFTCVLFRSWVAHQFFACKNVGICRSYWPSPGWTAQSHAKCPSTARIAEVSWMVCMQRWQMQQGVREEVQGIWAFFSVLVFWWHARQASLAFDWSCNSKPEALKTATGTGLKKRLDNSSGKLCCPYIAQAGHSCIAAGLLTWCHFFPRRCNHRLCWSWSYYKQLTRLTKRVYIYDLWLCMRPTISRRFGLLQTGACGLGLTPQNVPPVTVQVSRCRRWLG